MKKKLATIFVVFLLWLSPLIVKPVSSQTSSRFVPAIVSTEWLATNINLPNLVVLDVRSGDAYNAGHIPGAINVPEGQWYANPPFGNATPWMEMPQTSQLFKTIGDAGITRDSIVVVVGSTSGPLAPVPFALYATAGITRVAVALLYAGIKNVAILDGGYDKWVAEGRPTSTVPSTRAPVTYTGTVKSEMVVSKEYVKSRIGQSVIVDARDSIVYLAAVVGGVVVQEPWTARPGHIPTAVNLPTPWLWSTTTDESGQNALKVTYKSINDLRTLAFDIIGSDISKEVIVYCGVGGYASTMYFVLSEALGYTNVKIYDGSAQEWSHDMSLPMVPPGRTLPAIVSTTWLYNNLGLPNLVVLDVRSGDAYNAGHIPGAINVPEGQWYANPPFGNATPWMEMPQTSQLFKTIGDAGITNNSFVVVVGGTSGPLSPMPLALYSAAGITRVAITILYAGVPNVAVLDGGFDKWKLEGKPISTAPATPTPVAYSGPVKSGMIVSKQYVNSKIDQAVIVDARDPEVYLGFVKEPWCTRVGHIPSAKNLPTPWLWILTLNETTGNVVYSTYHEISLLRLMGSIATTNKSAEIIVYCGVGGYASTMYFVLSEALGYTNVKIYDGSAQEWTADLTLPVVYEALGSENMELSKSFDELKSKYDDLMGNYSSLEDSYKKLIDSYEEISSKYDDLKGNFEALRGNYDKLTENYNKLQGDYSRLQGDYSKLSEKYGDLESAYDELAKTTTPAYLTYAFVATTIIFLLLAVYLALRLRAKKS